MAGWSLDIQDASWVEHAAEEARFVVEALHLKGTERILDLACGFGRHALELARRGYPVVGVDITPEFIEHARACASAEGLDAQFICADVLDVTFREEFDVVMNMADGAIGYFATEEENLKLFDVIASALKLGGKHVMGVCSGDHAAKHFPKRHWQAGSKSLSLADFQWNAAEKRMIYRGHSFKFGEVLAPLPDAFPDERDAGIRLYTLDELRVILSARGMTLTAAYGAYNIAVSASAEEFMLVACSQKSGTPNSSDFVLATALYAAAISAAS